MERQCRRILRLDPEHWARRPGLRSRRLWVLAFAGWRDRRARLENGGGRWGWKFDLSPRKRARSHEGLDCLCRIAPRQTIRAQWRDWEAGMGVRCQGEC